MAFTQHMQRRAKELARLSKKDLNEYSDYAAKNKKAWQSAGNSVLRAMAKHMKLTNVRVNKNRSGIAGSGDVTLYGTFITGHNLHICFSEPLLHGMYSEPEFYYRQENLPSGARFGRNISMTFAELAQDLDQACTTIKKELGVIRPVIN